MPISKLLMTVSIVMTASVKHCDNTLGITFGPPRLRRNSKKAGGGWRETRRKNLVGCVELTNQKIAGQFVIVMQLVAKST